MNTLYPPIEPFATHRMTRDGGHSLYIEECGRPDGTPVIFLHGGPGSGCTPEHRRYFDPTHYRIVLLDQRGSGRSTPQGRIEDNRTEDLVSDLEAIRSGLRVEHWLLFGGSWGATLALAYALTNPQAVSGMILRGTFLAREKDLDWFFGPAGAARIFPTQWQAFSADISATDWATLVRTYRDWLEDPDPQIATRAAAAWSSWSDRVATWNRPRGRATQAITSHATTSEGDARRLAKARIEAHYACHRHFLEENAILCDAAHLPVVPLTLIHGQRDLVCPLEAAWSLARAVPNAQLMVLPEAGHLASEPTMIDALVGETDRLRDAGVGTSSAGVRAPKRQP